MTIRVSEFGTWDGKRVDQFHFQSETGVEVDIISLGVIVRDWRVPLRGGFRSVVQGFDELELYPKHSPYFGAIAGRVANRIRGASFELDGVRYELPANDGAHHLHGGPQGLAKHVWEGEIDGTRNAVRFTHTSPDGAMGYPGTVTFSATYSLAGNRLRLELAASPDSVTPISLVQHQYFNLGVTDTILDHTVRIDASAYTALGEKLIPTGEILPVDGTKFDLRSGRTMRDENRGAVDYDNNMVLSTSRSLADPVAFVTGEDGALTLRLWTDRPGVQFYNGVTTNVAIPGRNGRPYKKNSGLCLEDQAFPDAVHHPHFPSIIYSPDRPYSHWSEIEIG